MNTLSDQNFEDILSRIKDLFFIQIGANDGVTYDPIHHLVKKHNWAGILIEPNIECFSLLQQAYKDNTNLSYEMAAIADIDGTLPLYHNYTTLHQTLDITHAKNMFKTEDLKFTHVPCITLSSLFKKYNVIKLNFLQIDVEGYDCHIINKFPFSQFIPDIIRFEHIHTPQDLLQQTTNFLKTYNYNLYLSEDKCDIIATLH